MRNSQRKKTTEEEDGSGGGGGGEEEFQALLSESTSGQIIQSGSILFDHFALKTFFNY